MTKKLLLINPVPKNDVNLGKMLSFMRMPPLNLGYIAALTPKTWDIEIVDENIRHYNGEEADLVCFTSMTYNAPRVYELASHFRARNIPVVMGGIHASMVTHEALQFVDSVVVGEAESVWYRLVTDFENNNLQRVYNGERGSLKNLVQPRKDVYSRKYNIRNVIQTAKGCPMNCDFCSVTAFNGGVYRQRPVEDVLDELETIDSKLVFFVDDNIIGYGKNAEQRSIELFKGIIDRGLNIKWGSQASINFVDNEEVLKYARESGCFGLFVGFESLNESSLKSMHKVRNLESGVGKYREEIRKFQNYGIGVLGGFILGNDEDKKDIFERTSDFILDSNIDGSQFSFLTPLPGTNLYQRLKEENRLLYTDYPHDWIYYDVFNVVFRPKNMTPEELEEGALNVYKATASVPKSLRRAFTSLVRTRNVLSAVAAYSSNRGYASIFSRKYGSR